jgi:hypothetical protein
VLIVQDCDGSEAYVCVRADEPSWPSDYVIQNSPACAEPVEATPNGITRGEH